MDVYGKFLMMNIVNVVHHYCCSCIVFCFHNYLVSNISLLHHYVGLAIFDVGYCFDDDNFA